MPGRARVTFVCPEARAKRQPAFVLASFDDVVLRAADRFPSHRDDVRQGDGDVPAARVWDRRPAADRTIHDARRLRGPAEGTGAEAPRGSLDAERRVVAAGGARGRVLVRRVIAREERHERGLARVAGGMADSHRTKCARDWPDDFQMRNYCEEQQLKFIADGENRSIAPSSPWRTYLPRWRRRNSIILFISSSR